MKIEAVLESHLPRMKIRSFIRTLADTDITTAQEVEKNTGVDRRTCQTALEDFCKKGEFSLTKTRIANKLFYGSKKAISLLETKFKERYGSL